MSRVFSRLLHSQSIWKEGLTVFGVFLFTALFFSWPLCVHITESIPAGSEPPSVALFQLFTAEWTGKVLGHGGSYWNAPFFYPHQGAFAWCEPQPFTNLLIWLVSILFGWITAYNIVLIAYSAALGFAGYLTSRFLTNDRIASLWSGIWLAGGAYSIQQSCSTMRAAAFPAGCIFFSLVFFKNKKLRFFWMAVSFYVLSWLTCKKLAGYLTVFLPVILSFFLFSVHRPTEAENRRPDIVRRSWIHFFLAAGVLAACILPHSLQQYAYTRAMGFGWELKKVEAALFLKNLFVPAQGHWLTTRIMNLQIYSWDIGIIPLTVIVGAVLLGILKSRPFDGFQKRLIAGLCSVIILAIVLGFGRKFILYRLLFRFIPFLAFIRAPSKIIFFAIFGISVLSAPAFAYLRDRSASITRGRRILTCAFFILLFAEMWAMPVSLVFPGKEISGHREIINWLREYGKGSAVLELPIAEGLLSSDTELDSAAMLRMLEHGNPIINGYETFCPVPYKQLKKAMAVDPQGMGRRYLGAYGVRYAVVHEHMLTPQMRERLCLALPETVVYVDGEHSIYEFPRQLPVSCARGYFPVSAAFEKKIPQRDRKYCLRLAKIPDEAVLIPPQQDWCMDFNWTDKAGRDNTKRVRMKGSILLDAGQTQFYFRVLHFSRGALEGEAVLMSKEEAER